MDTKAAVKNIYKTFSNAIATGNMNLLDDVMTPGIVDHNPDPQQKPGLAEIKKSFAGLRTAFPDFQFHVQDIIAEGDKVAVRLVVEGTHQGDFLGIPATGKRVRQELFDFLHLSGGKIAERWGLADTFGLLNQLGAGFSLKK